MLNFWIHQIGLNSFLDGISMFTTMFNPTFYGELGISLLVTLKLHGSVISMSCKFGHMGSFGAQNSDNFSPVFDSPIINCRVKDADGLNIPSPFQPFLPGTIRI